MKTFVIGRWIGHSHTLLAQRCTIWYRWLRPRQKHARLVCSNVRCFRLTHPKVGWKSFPCETFWHAWCLAFRYRALQATPLLYNSCVDFAIAEANRLFPPPCRFSWSASSPTRWVAVSVTLDLIFHVVMKGSSIVWRWKKTRGAFAGCH